MNQKQAIKTARELIRVVRAYDAYGVIGPLYSGEMLLSQIEKDCIYMTDVAGVMRYKRALKYAAGWKASLALHLMGHDDRDIWEMIEVYFGLGFFAGSEGTNLSVEGCVRYVLHRLATELPVID